MKYIHSRKGKKIMCKTRYARHNDVALSIFHYNFAKRKSLISLLFVWKYTTKCRDYHVGKNNKRYTYKTINKKIYITVLYSRRLDVDARQRKAFCTYNRCVYYDAALPRLSRIISNLKVFYSTVRYHNTLIPTFWSIRIHRQNPDWSGIICSLMIFLTVVW